MQCLQSSLPDHTSPQASWLVDNSAAGQFEHDWWYYFKKKYALYPGISRFRAGDFLTEYYRHRQSRQSLIGKMANAAVFAGFHIWLPWRAREIAAKYGLPNGWIRQAVAIGRQCIADPNDIALFRIENAEQMRRHLRRFEHAAISKLVNPLNWLPDCRLGNKLTFHNACRAHMLPHPEIYAVARDSGIAVYKVPEDGLLAFKPTGGEGGRGFGLIDFRGGDSDREARFQALVAARMKGRTGSWMIQRKLDTHPELRAIGLSALLTARISTMLNEQGEPEVVTSVMRLPADGSSLVDNIKSGGLMAPIDLETGLLGPGCVGRGVGEASHHPASGAAIEGLRVPYLQEAVALALRAHADAFPDYTLVGWDVAITGEGPYLLEGNGKPCMIVAQRAPRKGLGETRFGQLVRFHLRRALGEADDPGTSEPFPAYHESGPPDGALPLPA